MDVRASGGLLNRVVRGTERRVRGGRLSVIADHDQALHGLANAPWPCADRDEFERLWPAVLDSLRERGLALGRGAYGGWDDADQAFARTVWCLTLHLRPLVVLETGVARGLTSRFALEALERAGSGRLLSIDLPPVRAGAAGLADQTGAAVPPELRARWTLLRGSSRRYLPGVVDGLAALGVSVDLFIHDSLHTSRNTHFEIECAWRGLSAGGVVLVDDIEQNAAFGSFARAHADAKALVCDAADGRSQFGCLVRSPTA
jgi:hypothetical protein